MWAGSGRVRAYRICSQRFARSSRQVLTQRWSWPATVWTKAVTARWQPSRPSAGRVVFAGFIQQDAIPRIYAAADVLVFPTLGDPHGLVVEEAMASHLPVVVTTAAGDIEQRLPDGEAGFIIPPADAEALAERMERLANDPELRRRMGDRGADLVAVRTHERYAEDFERFVEAVLDTPRRRPSTLSQ